jgi:hypothetical protein
VPAGGVHAVLTQLLALGGHTSKASAEGAIATDPIPKRAPFATFDMSSRREEVDVEYADVDPAMEIRVTMFKSFIMSILV